MNKKTHVKAHFCVIGAGSGGLSFAAGASQMGAKVVLLEKNKMGGDCLNYGCVPSKALISVAHKMHAHAASKDFLTDYNFGTVEYPRVHDYIHQVISNIAPHDSQERFEKLGVQVIREAGHFTDPSRVETDNYSITAKYFILATGSHPFIPPIPGLDKVVYYTNETLFSLKKLPTTLAIVGGGPIGIEMAQAFRRLGSKVVVLEAFSILPKDDPAFTAVLKEKIQAEGVQLHEKIKIQHVSESAAGIEIKITDLDDKQHTIVASHLLVSTGRVANIQDLNLPAANVHSTSRAVIVNDKLKTSNPKVFAMGDCVGGYQFTHVAGYHAGLVVRNAIFKMKAKVSTRAIPWVTYTDPELAHVGYQEQDLIHKKMPYKALNMTFAQNDRAQAENRTEGKIKVLVGPKGKIYGATILGVSAGELIYPWVIAIENELKIGQIANAIAPYPTLNELNKRVASSYFSETLFGKKMRTLVKILLKI